jgi:hypothetical protein
MMRAVRRLNAWIDTVEGATLVQVGQPDRRWSWFQITWAGLHAAALVMHLLSVLYHARRVVCTEATEPLFTAGCPARHVPPVRLLARPAGQSERPRETARIAAS